ncbi:hypothetical protein [Trinickia acidisoli]|uniref:hypothetical protein n=1 Tax=Trinickia acidisoli TaxID=2767482 RepID=UPI001A8F4AAB|nr:hypothetical protein [Trinickia acidisoli]
MDIIELARQAGLQVLLDARIGSQTYHSICGSLPALQRFAEAVEAATREQSRQPRDAVRHRAGSAHRPAVTRLRKRAPRCRETRARTGAGTDKTRATFTAPVQLVTRD